jgi:Cd2+/Zn2+-exporting ATPase
VVVSFPTVAKIATGFAAQFGTLFNSASVMEKTASADTAIIDKNGVFTQSSPKLLSMQSDILDKKVFMDFVAHAVYYSEQPFAKAIADAFEEEYRLELVSDFNDIPGAGCDAKIGGALVTFGTRELFTGRGEAVPYEANSDHPVFYLMVAGKYIGKIELSDDVNQDSASLIEDLKINGISQCVLMTEEGKDESEHLGTTLDADAVYAECDTEKKVKVIAKVSAESPNSLFIYANGIEQHSAAAVDIRISSKTKYADALVAPDQVGDLPAAIKACRRMKEVMQENGLFAYLIKVLMIYLSILGKVSIWFVFFIDIVAGLATILNAIRVTQEPLFDVWKLFRKQ